MMEVALKTMVRGPRLGVKLRVALVAVLAGLAAVSFAPAGEAAPPWTHEHIQQAEPRQSIHVVRVDLSDARVSVEMPPAAPDPDGPGPWETKLEHTSKVAAAQGLAVAVNAGFFAGKDKIAAFGVEKPYFRGNFSRLVGPGLHDGLAWSAPDNPQWPLLLVTGDGRVQIGTFATLPQGTEEAVAGSDMLVDDGKLVAPDGQDVHPRTLAGVSQDGNTLLLVTVDGRRPGHATGMTLAQAARLMQELGAYDALNLDGGGSTTLVLPDEAGEPRVVNIPSDGANMAIPLAIERPVANVVGIRVRPAASPDTPPEAPAEAPGE